MLLIFAPILDIIISRIGGVIISSYVDFKSKNGTTYVYESTGHWNKEKQMCICERRCIGKRDPITREIIFSKKYLEEVNRNANPTPVYCRNFSGATYLMDAIGDKLGITEDLKKSFPDTYKKLLSIAYYLVLEGGSPVYRFSRWAASHAHPYGTNISSQRISDIFGTITEDAKQSFFKAQGKRRIEKEYLAYDTTSISSYSESLKQVKYGKNKDGDSLPQINLALLFGEESGLPFYYRKFAGNITDVKTIQGFLRDIDFLEMKKVKLVMDRGFYSENNINSLYSKHLKFLIGGKLSLTLIKKKLDEVRTSMVTRSHYSSAHDMYADSYSLDWHYNQKRKHSNDVNSEEKRIYLHLYFNHQKAVDDKTRFNRMLDILEFEIKSGERNPENEKRYAKYFDIKNSPKRGITLTPKQGAINEQEKNYGYFALLSNGIKDPLIALEIYRTKDMVEKAFGNLKERLNMRRTSVSSEENLEGKLFVQFIALIYMSYIKKVMVDNKLFKNYTMQELIDEFDVIESFTQPNHKCRFGEITKKQRDLYEYFGAEVPT